MCVCVCVFNPLVSVFAFVLTPCLACFNRQDYKKLLDKLNTKRTALVKKQEKVS